MTSRHISGLFWYHIFKNRIKNKYEFWLQEQSQARFDRMQNQPYSTVPISCQAETIVYNWMADFAIFQKVPGFVLVIRTLSLFIRSLQIWYQNKREMCLLLLVYFYLHYIKQFMEHLDFNKWQGTFFDEFMFHPYFDEVFLYRTEIAFNKNPVENTGQYVDKKRTQITRRNDIILVNNIK